MRPSFALRSSAPSKSLLRFLRSQSEAVSFFSANPEASTSRQHAPSTEPVKNPVGSISNRRHISSTSSRHAPPQSAYLDELRPRLRDPSLKALPSPRHLQPHHSSHRFTGHFNGTRFASTESKTSSLGFFRRLLSLGEDNPASKKKLCPDDLPPNRGPYEDPAAHFFNLSRALSRDPSGADLKLRCTEFDANGSVTLVSGEFKKSELIAKYGLLPRDLRKIDSSILPNILIRPSAILINLLHLRVLIQSDRVLVFDAWGSTDSYTQSLFMYDLEGKLRQKADPRSTQNGPSNYLPYEFRALEAVLMSVTSGLESEFVGVYEPVVRVLRALEEDIDRDKLRHLLIHSKKLGTFEQKARLVRDAINDLLDADDDLAAMYLTERSIRGHSREEDDHQEVEILLESYHKICDEIVEMSSNLINNIRNTEEVVKAILDANRNSLMLLDIKFSVGTLGLATGTLFAGLYGMNLKNFIEESDVAFAGLTVACFGVSAIVCLYGMKRLRKLQRVRMWGEGYGSDLGSARGNWRNEAMEHAAMIGESRAGRINRLKMEKAPVLWPGMDGLGLDDHRLAQSIPDLDGETTGELGNEKAMQKVEVPPVPPVPPMPPVKKGAR